MADYRDDRAALHARVEQQESELEQLRAEAERLRARAVQADALEAELGKLQKPRRGPNMVMVGALFAVALLFTGGIVFTLVARSSAPPVAVAVAPSPVTITPPVPSPSPARGERAAGRAIPSCSCEDGDGGRTTLAYEVGATMSFGTNATTYVSWGLVDAGGKRVKLATGGSLVPPNALAGGAVSMRLACPAGAMVVALDQRATAWSREDGRELWSASLPAPVGESRGGPLAPTCEKLALDPKGNIIVIHAGGRTVLRA
ncbi:MAG: hypothetical protein KC657_39595, partial [Myxococcales bacterium]|nr:hypothetical protein [Myxococcales bacterium]